MPRACIVFNLIPVFFGKNVRILHVTGSILENPVRTRYRVAMRVILIEKGILIARSNIGSVTPAIGPL